MPIPRYYRLSVSTSTNCPHDRLYLVTICMCLCGWTSCISAWLLSWSLANITPRWMCKWVTQCFHCALDSDTCILVHSLIVVMCWSHIDCCFLRMSKSHMFSHYYYRFSTSVASVSITDMWLRMRILNRIWSSVYGQTWVPRKDAAERAARPRPHHCRLRIHRRHAPLPPRLSPTASSDIISCCAIGIGGLSDVCGGAAPWSMSSSRRCHRSLLSDVRSVSISFLQLHSRTHRVCRVQWCVRTMTLSISLL